MTDPVNNPAHYQSESGIECIDADHNNSSPPYYKARDGSDIECFDALKAMLGKERFIGFLQGSAVSYMWRLHDKENPLLDAQKALKFCERIVKEIKE